MNRQEAEILLQNTFIKIAPIVIAKIVGGDLTK